MSYPDFISDRDGLDRWRESSRKGDGHDMVANKNTVHRFVQTVDKLEAALRAMLEHYGPPASVAALCDYPEDHPITLARRALSLAVRAPR